MQASDDALKCTLGIDPGAAEVLLAAREFMQWGHFETLVSDRISVGDHRLKAFLIGELQSLQEERLVAILLDSQSCLIRVEHVGGGSRSNLVIPTRSLVRRILELNASKVILAHNHPSGVARPSDSDRKATASFEKVAIALGIELMDHCIVAGGEVFSMRLGSGL